MSSFTNRIMVAIRARSPSALSPSTNNSVEPSSSDQGDNSSRRSTSSTAVDTASPNASPTIRFAEATQPPRVPRRRTETVSHSTGSLPRHRSSYKSSTPSRPRAPSYVTVPTIPGQNHPLQYRHSIIMTVARQATRLGSSLKRPGTLLNARPITSSNIFAIAAASPAQIYPYNQTRGYVADHKPFKDGSLSQGHSIDPKNLHPEDTESQSVKGGLDARKKKDSKDASGSMDAATERGQGHERGGKGNPEGIGMVDQVGSATGSSQQFKGDKKKSKQQSTFQRFEIRWKDSVRSNNSMGRTYIDGIRCGVAKGINKRGYRQDPTTERDTACQDGVVTSSTQARELIFSDLSFTDEEEIIQVIDGAGTSQRETELGTIRLEVVYVQKGENTRLKIVPFEPYQKVNERSMKGMPMKHQTRLGGSVTRPFSPVFSVRVLGAPRIFTFKYRPRHVLQGMGIMRPPTPPQVIDLSMDSDDEMMQVDATFDAEEQHDEGLDKSRQYDQGDSCNMEMVCEFDERAMDVNENKSEALEDAINPVLKSEDLDDQNQVKNEIIDDFKVNSPLKAEPEDIKVNVKTETEDRVKVEIKVEDGSTLRVKKEEEVEVANSLLSTTDKQ
ncbi:hypothetical protein CVT24_009119 [Panaeolus cyanescens]|uniref:DUF7918 domain-containing protein n=1 Tax=Panaeolus cyanescens TaxID=181874 RepID=A0A409VAM2_9AGAR|nr:hypothetical protein CVT24_009119 [Panaeolus cyanescens]